MSIIGKLPPVKGSLIENVDISKKTTLGVGGIVDVLFVPHDMDDLVFFLRNMDEDFPITVLGGMSNVLIRSGGIRGVVIILGEWFDRIFIENGIIEVGARVNCAKMSTMAMDNELGGLEFLMGIPGTIGGAVKMNAGCYGSEISDVLVECEAVTFEGKIKWLKASDINFQYRHTDIPNDLIITRAWFRGNMGVRYSIPKKVNEFMAKRKESQPFGKRSSGSFFKNANEKKAWELINEAGCRGMRLGGAMVSDKHCNFIINDSNATADNVEDLAELVAKKVLENSGISLEWEVVRLGDKL